MKIIKVTDMSNRLNADGKYYIRVSGEELMSQKSKEVFLDASDLNIDQISAIAGFLDAVFDDSHIDKLTGVSIVKPEDIENKSKSYWIEMNTNEYSCSSCNHCLTIDPTDNSIAEMKVCPFCVWS